MNTRTKITGLAAAVLLTGSALAGGIAQAQTHQASGYGRTAPSGEATSPDNDAIQQGDPSGPDGPGPARAAHAAAKPAHPARTSANSGESATRSSGDSEGGDTTTDGPGGHQDPAGNVDHQFNGEE